MNKIDLVALLDEHRRRMGQPEESPKIKNEARPSLGGAVAGNAYGAGGQAQLYGGMHGGINLDPAATLMLPPYGGFQGGAGAAAAGTSFQQQHHQQHQQPLSPPLSSAIADYAMLQQRMFLEDQARRDLVAQAMANSQFACPPGMGGGLLPMAQQEQAQRSLLAGGGFARPAPMQQPRTSSKKQKLGGKVRRATKRKKRAGVPPPSFSLSRREKKSKFPLPAGAETEGTGAVPLVGALSSLRKRWNAMNEKCTSITDPEEKERAVAEFFARRLVSSKDADIRLSEKVQARLEQAGIGTKGKA